MDLLHTCLNVADAERSAAFYIEELGFEESWSFETDDGRTLNQYVAADNGVELQLAETEGENDFKQGTAWDHLAVSVESTDRAFEEIDHYGVVQEPADQPAAGARTAFIEDPDGHVVELVESLDE
jgi:lactoylglutathione lyase